jgi:hypothetical protein
MLSPFSAILQAINVAFNESLGPEECRITRFMKDLRIKGFH